LLSSKEIVLQIALGNIVITPFQDKLLNANSYDVRLGEFVCRQQEFAIFQQIIRYNSDDGQDKMWKEPERLESGQLLIRAGETVLAHTEEVIGGRNVITTEMRAKSTTGRYGLSVCKCAGLGDIGFVSRWTMEITNHSNFHIAIKVGEPIAQIIFHHTEEPLESYSGRYGQGEWTPSDMLPKRKIYSEN